MQTIPQTFRFSFLCLAILGLIVSQTSNSVNLLANQKGKQKTLPQVGDVAKDFTLQTTAGKEFRLKDFAKNKKTVLVVLRGFPGYQCPLCTRQVGEFLSKIQAIKKSGAELVFVYPGPSQQLPQKANDFLKGIRLPQGATVLLDPDYRFTNQYGLRWNRPNETAYPSTFILDSSLKIHFAKISKSHGGRSSVAQVLSALEKF